MKFLVPLTYNSEYTPTTTKVRVFDQSTHTFTTEKTVNSTFMTNYSLTIGGNDYIYIKVEENSGTWKAYIYNFAISGYEFLDSQGNDSGHTYGWSIWEEYNLTGQCASTSPRNQRYTCPTQR